MNVDTLTDRDIVCRLLKREAGITRDFFFIKCYPLFKSIFDRYDTGCESCFEFVNDIYLFIMDPLPKSGMSRLEGFGFRCTLTMWLKIICENYCRKNFARSINSVTESLDNDDRLRTLSGSLDETFGSFDAADVRRLLDSMPNARYRRLIELRYVEELDNEQTAERLGMTMANYYNKHKLAKAQFCNELRKEGLL